MNRAIEEARRAGRDVVPEEIPDLLLSPEAQRERHLRRLEELKAMPLRSSVRIIAGGSGFPPSAWWIKRLSTIGSEASMPPDIEAAVGSEERLRAALSITLRAFAAENRGALSAAEVARVGTAHLVDAAWHLCAVTMPEPRGRSFILGLAGAAFDAMAAGDPATPGDGA